MLPNLRPTSLLDSNTNEGAKNTPSNTVIPRHTRLGGQISNLIDPIEDCSLTNSNPNEEYSVGQAGTSGNIRFPRGGSEYDISNTTALNRAVGYDFPQANFVTTIDEGAPLGLVRYHVYYTSASFTPPTDYAFLTLQYLLVSGGGAGGSVEGGGGGAGTLITGYLTLDTSDTELFITVGSGGTGVANNRGNNGGSSSIFGLISLLGGGGGGSRGTTQNGADGASGGGAAGTTGLAGVSTIGLGLGNTVTLGNLDLVGNAFTLGNAGGSPNPSLENAGGGGGGYSALGGNALDTADATLNDPGDGGAGIELTDFDILGSPPGWYCGGGGGGTFRLTAGTGVAGGLGGQGGGGRGGEFADNNVNYRAGFPGIDGTGGGGGGGGGVSSTIAGGRGGSGIAILRYPLDNSFTPVPVFGAPQFYSGDGLLAAFDNNRYHVFTSTTTITFTQDVTVNLLLVGGGGGGAGGGASFGGGGGGSGHVRTFTNINLLAGTYNLVVGTAGNGGAITGNGTAGTATNFNSGAQTASFGSPGAYPSGPGGNGGSGGGASPHSFEFKGDGGTAGTNGIGAGSNSGGTGGNFNSIALDWLTPIASAGLGGEGGINGTRPPRGGGGGGGVTISNIPEISATQKGTDGGFSTAGSNGKGGNGFGGGGGGGNNSTGGVGSPGLVVVHYTVGLPAAPPTIILDNLVVHLDARDTDSYPGSGTTWTDLSGNNNHGTLVNGPTFDGDIVVDGSNDFIRLDSVPSTGTATQSVSWGVWVYPQSTSGNIMSMSSTNPQGSWNMPPIRASSQTFTGKIWNNTQISALSSYTLNTWYYVVLVWKYSAITAEAGQFLYVNGLLQASQTNIVYSSSGVNNFLFLGQSNPGADNTGMFTGKYGMFHVYGNKALTAEEVEYNFETTRGNYGV